MKTTEKTISEVEEESNKGMDKCSSLQTHAIFLLAKALIAVAKAITDTKVNHRIGPY